MIVRNDPRTFANHSVTEERSNFPFSLSLNILEISVSRKVSSWKYCTQIVLKLDLSLQIDFKTSRNQCLLPFACTEKHSLRNLIWLIYFSCRAMEKIEINEECADDDLYRSEVVFYWLWSCFNSFSCCKMFPSFKLIMTPYADNTLYSLS